MRTVIIAILTISWLPLFAQHKVDPGNTYHRLLCIVPIVGSGTFEDPRHQHRCLDAKRHADDKLYRPHFVQRYRRFSDLEDTRFRRWRGQQ